MANKKIKTPSESFTAKSWLFRELLDKMKRNNVKSMLLYTKDAEGNETTFDWCVPKNKKAIIKLLEE